MMNHVMDKIKDYAMKSGRAELEEGSLQPSSHCANTMAAGMWWKTARHAKKNQSKNHR